MANPYETSSASGEKELPVNTPPSTGVATETSVPATGASSAPKAQTYLRADLSQPAVNEGAGSWVGDVQTGRDIRKEEALKTFLDKGLTPEQAEAAAEAFANDPANVGVSRSEVGRRIALNFGAPTPAPTLPTTQQLADRSLAGVEIGQSTQTGRTQAYQEDTRPEALKNQRQAEDLNVLVQQNQLDKQALDAAQKFQQEQTDFNFYSKWADEQEAKAKVDLLKKQQAEAEAESKSAANAEVDPRRLFKQKGTFGSILLALSSGLESFGRALQGNFGETVVQKMLNDDIRQQELEIARKGKKADNRLAQLTSELDNKERAVEQLKIEQLTALFDKQKAAFDKETNPLKKQQMNIDLVKASNELNKAYDASKYPVVTNQITKNTAAALAYGRDAAQVGSNLRQQITQRTDGYQTTTQPAQTDGYVTAGTDGYQAEKPVITLTSMPKSKARTAADTALIESATKANEDKKQFQANIQRIDDEVKAGRLTPEQADQAKRDIQANLDRIERDRAEAERIVNLPTAERRTFEEDKIKTKYAKIGLQLLEEAKADEAAFIAGKMTPEEKAQRELARHKLSKENEKALGKELLQVRADFAEPKVQPKPVIGKVASKPVSEAKPDYQKQLDDLNLALINGSISKEDYDKEYKRIVALIPPTKPEQKTGGESGTKTVTTPVFDKRTQKQKEADIKAASEEEKKLRAGVSEAKRAEIFEVMQSLRELDTLLRRSNIFIDKDGKAAVLDDVPGATFGQYILEKLDNGTLTLSGDAGRLLDAFAERLAQKAAVKSLGALNEADIPRVRKLYDFNTPKGKINFLLSAKNSLIAQTRMYSEDPGQSLYVDDYLNAYGGRKPKSNKK